MKILVKICGLTNVADLEYTLEHGPDMVGFIFANSPRKVSVQFVKSCRNLIKSNTKVVGVFANHDMYFVEQVFNECKLDYAQLHGNENRNYIKHLKVPYIKVFKGNSPNALLEIEKSKEKLFLIDSTTKDNFGGTGKTFDWEVAVKAKEFGKVIMAGGLSPMNIRDAIETVNPYGVDISSGVEQSPGIKDKSKIKHLFEEINNVQ